MNKIRDLVLQDAVALRKWNLVIDDLVPSPKENMQIKELLKEFKYEHAVLESLVTYGANGGSDLIGIFRQWNLDKLADNVRELLETDHWLMRDVSDPAAVHLMKLVSYLDPKMVTIELLEKMAPVAQHLPELEKCGAIKIDAEVRAIQVLKPVSHLTTKQEEVKIIEIVQLVLEKVLEMKPVDENGAEFKEEAITHSVALLPHLLKHDNLVIESWALIARTYAQLHAFANHVRLLHFAEQASARLATVHGDGHENTILMRRMVGEAHLLRSGDEHAQGRPEANFRRVVAALEPVVPVSEKSLGEVHMTTLLVRDSLARAYNGTGQYRLALSLTELGIRLSHDTYGEIGITIALKLTKGIVLFTMERFDDALPILEYVVRVGPVKLGVNNPAMAMANGIIMIIYRLTGRQREAHALENELEHSEVMKGPLFAMVKPILSMGKDEAPRSGSNKPAKTNFFGKILRKWK